MWDGCWLLLWALVVGFWALWVGVGFGGFEIAAGLWTWWVLVVLLKWFESLVVVFWVC